MSELHTVPVNKDAGEDGKSKLKDETDREFEITALLCKIKQPGAEFDFDLSVEHGGSFIFHPSGQWQLHLETPGGKIECKSNSSNELAAFVFKCQAKSRIQAMKWFHDAVAPALDSMSFVHDVPIQFDKISCLDKKHSTTSVVYTAPYQKVQLSAEPVEYYIALRPYYALYREAKNSNSDYYRFLCYFKILEGIYRRLRPETRKAARELGVDLPSQRETVPFHPELKMWRPDDIGKPIGDLFSGEFETQYRHAIAHFALDDEAPLVLSDHGVSAVFSNMVFLIEICCRVVLESESKCVELVTSALPRPSDK